MAHGLSHLFEEVVGQFLSRSAGKEREAEDFPVQALLIKVDGEVLNNLPHFSPLALYVVGVHIQELAVDECGVAKLLRMIDRCAV